jgi:hypothetical protein
MTHLHYRIWSSTKSTMWNILAKRGYANDAIVGEGIPFQHVTRLRLSC